MAIDYLLLSIVAAVILVLPWNQKYTGTWNKIKKWYNYLLAALLISLIRFVLVYAPLTGNTLIYVGYIQTGIEVIAIILGTVGILGICKELLLK